MQDFKNYIDKFMAPLVKDKGFVYAQLVKHFDEIFPTEFTQRAQIVKIKQSKIHGGVLVLKTTSANAPLIYAIKDEIIEKINAYCKETIVHDVQCIHTLSKQTREEMLKALPTHYQGFYKQDNPASVIEISVLHQTVDLSHVSNEDLRSKLQSLGQTLMQKV